MCKKAKNEQKSAFEKSIFTELLFRSSDISQLAKWPLRIFAGICALGSVLIWYEKYDWYYFLNDKDMTFLGSFLHFTEILSIILKAGLFICFTVVLISLTVFIFSFFKRNTSKVMSEAIEVLLSNSFCFGVSLVFILLAASNLSRATSQIMFVTSKKIDCANNLKKLGKALLFYAEQNHHHYPSPDKWCDVLIENTKVAETDFLCPSAATGNCHYAINPNAEPLSKYGDFKSFLDSYDLDQEKILKNFGFLYKLYSTNLTYKKDKLPKLVLLLETKGGWNQFGGPELLTAENHEGEGANILFNDGSVKFVEPDGFSELKWKIEGKNSGQEGFSK